jgi:hypothetical protein
VAVQRVHERIPRAAAVATLGSALELGGAASGASAAGLVGLSIGLVLALCLEAALMARTIYESAALGELTWRINDVNVSSVERA